MSVLYVRDVPDEVTAVLKRRAAQDGISLSGYVARELARMAATPSNADLVERLGPLRQQNGPTTQEILAELDSGRR